MSNVLLGGAIGDALGMPFETMLVNNSLLVNWDGKTFLPCKYHGLESGQITDDGQMQQMVAESLVKNNGFNPDNLASRYLEWMTSGRWRGHGRTTKMALENLLAGKHWSVSGIAGSYGNGTAMRASPFGIYFRDDLKSLIEYVKIDSNITHASDEATAGAIAIALAAAYASLNETDDLIERICQHLPNTKVKKILLSLDSILGDQITASQALSVLGTKANVMETVPSAIYCFLKFNDFHNAVEAAIRAGGDTDTTASIVGALFGARDGFKSIDSIFHEVENFNYLLELDSKLYTRSNYTFFPRD